MVSLIIFFLLFLLPFVIAPFGVTQFENPKVIFGEIGILVLLLVTLFTNQVSLQRRQKQLLLYGVIVLITLINLYWFRTPISFFGNAFRMQGIFLLWLLLLFSFLSKRISFGPFDSLRPFNKWWVYAGLLYAQLIATFFLPLNESHRYVGTLGEPNALAAFAIFVWPFGWFGIKDTKRKWFTRFFLLLPVVWLLYLSGSKSGMIAFGIEMVFIGLVKVQRNRGSEVQSKILRLCCSAPLYLPIIICLVLYLCSYILPFFEHVPYENRVEVWESAFYAGMVNPGLGQGFGNTEITLHNAAAGLDLPIQYYYVDSSHNIFLDWWVQGGVIGLSVLLFIMYYVFAGFIRERNELGIVVFLGMLTALSFNPASVVGLLGFWWIIGQGLGYI